jgi:hypothetical protein
MADTETKRDSGAPAYVSFDTLRNFIDSLKATAVPDQIDRGLMSNMSGAVQSHLLSALRFLGLVVPPDDSVTQEFRNLVKAYGTADWKSTLDSMLRSAYGDLEGEIDITKTTDRQLRTAFQRVYSLEDSMVDRSVRFYRKGLAEAGVAVSPHVGRRRRSSGPRRNGQAKRGRPESGGHTETLQPPLPPPPPHGPEGMIDFPIPMGDKQGFIRVRADLTIDQFPLVEAMLQAVRVLAETNSKGR